MWTRSLALAVLVGPAVVACGRTDLTGSLETASDDAGTTANARGATATVDAGAMLEDGATDAEPDGAASNVPGQASSTSCPFSSICVDVDVSAYDQSCTRSEDCMAIASGTQCNWGCLCPDAAVNVSGQAQYEQAIGALPDCGDCGCPARRYPCCVEGRCVTNLSACTDSANPGEGGTD
jgi:hypothetical protein